MITLYRREYRALLLNIKTYVAITLFMCVLTPHIIWLHQNEWQSVLHATGNSSLGKLSAWGSTAVNLFFGLIAILTLPTLMIMFNHLPFRRPQTSSLRSSFGSFILIAPPAMIVIGSLFTFQILKPLWLLPITGMTALGLALYIDDIALEKLITVRRALATGVAASGAMLALFFIYLLGADTIDRSFASYSANMKPLGPAITRVWSHHSTKPLGCLVLRDRKLTAAAVLFYLEKARIIDDVTELNDLAARYPECVETGGMLITASNQDDQNFDLPNLCHGKTEALVITSMLGIARTPWTIFLTPFSKKQGSECPA